MLDDVHVSDEELVRLARHNAAGEGYLAEMGRRQLEASRELRVAMEKTSRRLYALNVVLIIYTVALVVFGAVQLVMALR